MSGFTIHKEIKAWDAWHHWDERKMNYFSFDDLCSVLDRYCIGTTMLPGEKIGGAMTSMAYDYEKGHIGDVYYLRSDAVARLRKVWPFGDFDKQVGHFLWDTGDVIGFPDETEENKAAHFEDYRMFIWG